MHEPADCSIYQVQAVILDKFHGSRSTSLAVCVRLRAQVNNNSDLKAWLKLHFSETAINKNTFSRLLERTLSMMRKKRWK